jgi:ribonuclease G
MNRIIINVNNFQKRAAIIEEGRVVEVLTEREDESNIIKNIYKGRVANVLPGMESAFVDIGLEKNSFLFVDDLREFEEKYIGQGMNENRTMEETLDLGWKLLGRLPREELDRVDTKILDKYYKPSEEE